MSAEHEVRALLARTWIPFFSRFGRLNQVQVQAIPRILAGENLVVSSPAASGKTEAVVAPVLERLLPAEKNRMAVLYVVPTRALVNDVCRRLESPLEYLGLALGRKTGDHAALNERKPPFLLVTTPESFDSLLCRHPRVFEGLAAVLLDELHLLDNTPRGDQLRVLLERVRRMNPRFQCCAASATIDDDDIGRRYFAEPGFLRVVEQRDVEQLLLPLDTGWQERVLAELVERDCRKVLFFFNSRSGAEAAVRELDRPPFAGRVWVHHASLTRSVREGVEELMNRERSGLLCCTSTLELGIDIGDVDAVVLVRPPFDVTSLMQRIGRGNRRRGSSLFAIGMYTGAWERFLFEVFVECAREGRFYEKRYTPSLAVVPQQIVSYMFQRRRIGTTLTALRRVLEPVYGDGGIVEQVFQHMAATGLVRSEQRGVWFLSEEMEEPVVSGRIHSNIQEKSFGTFEVIDVTANRTIGVVFFALQHFVLAGRSWEMIELRKDEGRLLVRPVDTVAPSTKVFEGTGTGGYGYRLASVLKRRLFPELAARQFPCFRDGGWIHYVHLLGGTYGALLAEGLRADGLEATDIDGKLLVMPGTRLKTMSSSFPSPTREALRLVVARNLPRFEDGLGSGAFLRFLPRELQVEDHLLALDIDGLLAHIESIEMVELPACQVQGEFAERLARPLTADRG